MNRQEHDRRPSIEHVMDASGRFDRALFVPGAYDRVGQPERIRVFQDPNRGDLVDIACETATSESATAQATEVLEKIILTEEQARWVHRVLGELVKRWDEEEARGLR